MTSISQLPGKLFKKPLQTMFSSVPSGVWQHLFPKDVISLCYHVVSDEDLPHVKYYSYKNVCQFKADLAYIQDHYRFISYDELVSRRLQKDSLPPNGFFLTFDDGLAECLTVIRPLLLERAVNGAFFVTTSFIDNRAMFFESKVSLCIGAIEKLTDEQATQLCRLLAVDEILQDPNRRRAFDIGMARFGPARIQPPTSASHRSLIVLLLTFEQPDEESIDEICEYLGIDHKTYLQQHQPCLTSAQIRQLFADGFTIGAHGITHAKLHRMSSPEQIESEIVTSCDTIRQLTGQKKVPFAFPYTGKPLDIAFLADLIRRYDFIELFFDTSGLRRSPTFIVNRLFADPPLGCVGDRTNLPQQLSEAWSEAEGWFQ